MIRSVCALATLVALASAVACANSSPYGAPYGSGVGSGEGASSGSSSGGRTGSTGGGNSGSGSMGSSGTGQPGGGTNDPIDAGAVEDSGGLVLVDGGVSAGDAAAPTSCTIGAAGPIALIPADTMAPGTACGACHASIGKPLNVAGTVYPTYHEPDLCLGVTGVQVQIVDSAGASHALSVDTSGNFYAQDPLSSWPTPWQASVSKGSAHREMVGPVDSGDCNSCHTAAGASSAPGRILAP